MKKTTLHFTGDWIHFLIMNLILVALSFITFGLLAPYLVFWNVKYIINNIELNHQY